MNVMRDEFPSRVVVTVSRGQCWVFTVFVFCCEFCEPARDQSGAVNIRGSDRVDDCHVPGETFASPDAMGCVWGRRDSCRLIEFPYVPSIKSGKQSIDFTPLCFDCYKSVLQNIIINRQILIFYIPGSLNINKIMKAFSRETQKTVKH